MKRRCDKCRYHLPSTESPKDLFKGECRVGPPIWHYLSQYPDKGKWQFPLVENHDWCYQFTGKK